MALFFVFQYLIWHYGDGLRLAIYKAINSVIGFLNFFSVAHLLRTFFYPWHRIIESYGRGFDAGRYFFIIAGNIISRVLGAIVRSFVIAAGIFAAFLAIVGGIFFVALWLVSPIVIPLMIAGGFILIFL